MTLRRVGRCWGRPALLAVLLVGCAAAPAAPPVHPLGAACTWPASVDVQRDGLAVLATVDYPPLDLVLLDVGTGTVVARCTGVGGPAPAPEFVAPGFANDPLNRGSNVLPPVSPDLRSALVPGGVVDLASGRVVADPVPGWEAAGLPGGGSVLRVRTPGRYHGVSAQPGDWCVAPRADAVECSPLVGEGPGVPVEHGDGTVGWISGVPVPAVFSGVPGVVQSDGERLVQARLDPSDRANGTGTIIAGSLRAGLLDESEVRFAPGVPDGIDERPTWFTFDGAGPGGATATMHTAETTWAELRSADLDGPYGAAVIDGGMAAVLAMGTIAGNDRETRFVMVREDGPVREVGRLRVTASGDIGAQPRIVAWPDPAPSVRP